MRIIRILAVCLTLVMLTVLSSTALAADPLPASRWWPKPDSTLPTERKPHDALRRDRRPTRYYDYYNPVIVTPNAYYWVYGPMGPILTNPANTQPEEKPANRATLGKITWSTEYLYQVYVNNRSIDFRVFGDGSKLAFRLGFQSAIDGTRMVMKVRGIFETLQPVFTKEALNTLAELGVTELCITSNEGDIIYTMDELRAMLSNK